jgi:hypothetical protein
LNFVSLENFTDYCLSYTFTSRDFSDGTLGLAWLASPTGVGGVCERMLSIQEVKKSLNSGIVTLVNYNTRVPELVSYLVFAHEIGHSFGAQHDTGACVPGNSGGGNFLMYSRATTGSQLNNNRFSSCSQSQMGLIVNSLARSPKFCLKARKYLIIFSSLDTGKLQNRNKNLNMFCMHRGNVHMRESDCRARGRVRLWARRAMRG